MVSTTGTIGKHYDQWYHGTIMVNVYACFAWPHGYGRGVGLRHQSRCGTTALVYIALGPGAHHADVEVPWYHGTYCTMAPMVLRYRVHV
jgi:hypothetical protein